jgi:prepilin-type N-terminal cleavage/methylation domain-containing protein
LKLDSDSPFKRRAAFSVVEMLIVVAIIGVFASIALVFLGGEHREAMLRVRDRRNAQEITALCMGATAAGAPVVAKDDMRGTIANLIEGRDGTVGSFKGHHFSITPLTEEEIQGAMKYLEWRQGLPAYVPGSD